MRVVDGDGHIFEDSPAIARFLPADYRVQRTPDRWFPPGDHFHAFIGETPPGSFRQVGPDGWLEFLDDVAIDAAVLYPTGGLAYGKVFHLDSDISLSTDPVITFGFVPGERGALTVRVKDSTDATWEHSFELPPAGA